MQLTIGMAAHDDFHGVAFSIQSLALHQHLEGCEIIVIDNHPSSEHGKATREFCTGITQRPLGSVRYIPMAEKTGTSQSRQRIFDESRGQAVLVMDCHVLFPAGTIDRLKRWYAERPDCRDLLSGPIILDTLAAWHTHFNDQWRGHMWGTWANAWRCTCDTPLRFTTLQIGQQVAYRDLATSRQTVEQCPHCGRTMPGHAWPGHESALIGAGFQPLGFSDSDEPFEIPGQGLGVFTCRKDAWLGFNPHFRGFGGEEMYIHEKFRRAGAKAICLPWLKWWHRFQRPGGVSYPLSLWQKVRNYVLGHQELSLPLDPVYDHFVSLDAGQQSLKEHLALEHAVGPQDLEGKTDEQLRELHRSLKLSESDWEALLADPVGRIHSPSEVQVAVSFETGRVQPPEGADPDTIFAWCQSVPRDLDQHLEKLRELAGQCEHITEFTKRRESTVGLAAGRPARLVSYQSEHDVLLKTLDEAIVAEAQDQLRRIESHTTHWRSSWYDEGNLVSEPIEETDLLFIDTVHHADRLSKELEIHTPRVRRFLVLRGTGQFGETSELGGPGLFHALRPFLEQHPQWFVIYHTDAEYGLTVLGRDTRDRPASPVHAWPPGYGPGTEFERIVLELGITMPDNCTCKALKNQMDLLGAPGCRANKDALVAQIKANAAGWGWSEKLGNYASAGWKSVTTGLALKINPLDPIPGLLDEAVRRAEAKAQQAAA